jgi:thioesterase domain-containing protein
MVQGIRLIQPAGPYHSAGHSFGGQVAYEIARQLHGKGERIPFLGFLDASAPFVSARGEAVRLGRKALHLGRKTVRAYKSRQMIQQLEELAVGRAPYWRMAMPEFASASISEQNYKPGP